MIKNFLLNLGFKIGFDQHVIFKGCEIVRELF